MLRQCRSKLDSLRDKLKEMLEQPIAKDYPSLLTQKHVLVHGVEFRTSPVLDVS